jgi:cytochrome c oxidase cbb3-type subunit 3
MSSASRLALAALVAIVSAACGPAPPSGGQRAPAPAPPAIGPVPGPSTPGVSGAAVPTANPYAQNRAATGEGRQLFVRFNCSGCHGGRAGGGMGPSLRDVDWIYGNDDARIYSSIAQGRAHGMPAWESRMTADQIWKLVTYIKSLRTTNEPNPPSS